ncbi:uncharacterized protein LACBIDRAFT_313400 [Laccaria bicolor S238N-H82]|uniref:Predicted protein n=1 Tax=Laccaria bicolor (strain S238N-H82 / ATCC MYA-4686) TaxID=486041 RepID=B0DY84_LACBS|nr:uncharacterized protein LACBIDRAFT_313400 [Laccaria bicolor S238N-H82]EDR00479.1 predicted protein [Laccaria bicolor S238N-H82]|eukprot:XP_001888871.1 predicted protein [Laccaria bicolor S238N-H82]
MPSKRGTCLYYSQGQLCPRGLACRFSHETRIASIASGKSPKRSRKPKSSRGGSGPLQEFFNSYHPFVYNSSSSASSEFYRLCDHFHWARDGPDREDAHDTFKDALVKQFNANFGTNADDLTAWQGLCALLDVDPIPDELARCRRIVERTHVNLVDLTDSFTSGKRVTRFKSEGDLSEYTIEHARYFPRKNVHAGNLLKHLLRHIHNPSLKRGWRRF